jgi:general secretion pathway protein E/type IV pilus assembly protein PilB
MDITINIEQQQLIDSPTAWEYRIIPIEKSDFFYVYIDEENITNEIEYDLKIVLGDNLNLISTDKLVIQRALGKYYRNATSENTVITHEKDFLEKIIKEAKQLGSSDIHIEIYDDKARVRIRIDGALVEKYIIPKEDYPELINKIKIKSNLDITEKRLPQDGRINYKKEAFNFDMRVSILPTLHGEKIVIRILGNDAENIDVDQIGFLENEKKRYLEGIKNPHGIVLISGPTGSGKTTTLYATLKLLNKPDNNILTVEDPIEYTLNGINQVQLKENIGLTFSSALKSFLRQDPDIIMVGEIRDSKTAEMAVSAALTGHLVLSTIHTNSAWETITRLKDMGIPSYSIADTLNVSVAQRLVKKLCVNCKKEVDLNTEDYPIGFNPKIKLKTKYIAIGCETCSFTGYKGRKAIFEVLYMDRELSECIHDNIANIDEILKKKKINKLSDSAMELFKNGETSLKEIYPILMNDTE